MAGVRPRIDVNELLKARTSDLKKKLKVKTEAEAVAYLLAFYEASNDGITMKQHEQFLKQAEQIIRQGAMKL